MIRWFLLLGVSTGLFFVLRGPRLDPTRAATDFEFHLSEDGASGQAADEYTFDICALGNGTARFRVLYEQSGQGGVIRQGILGPSEVTRFLSCLRDCGLVTLQSDGLPWARPQTCIRYREGSHETYWHLTSAATELDTLQTTLDAIDADASPDKTPLRQAYELGTRAFTRLRPRLINDPPLPPFALDDTAR